MRKYETLFVLKPSLDEEARKALIERFTNIIEQDGKVESINEWGNKKLAYEIEKIRDGYYVLVEFLANPDLPRELERNFRISDDVMRFIVVNLEQK